jgi:DNA topoisomerase-1
VALVVRLLDETLVRVGNEEYATENASFGLTTLRPNHVDLDGATIVLEFVGKGGKSHDVTIEDRRLARLVKRCHELEGQHLFSYRDRDGGIHGVSSGDVNGYLHEAVGPDTSAKVFRTWGASSGVVGILAPDEPPAEDADQEKHILFAIDSAAASLGNTRAVCRQSYVHPVVLDAFRSGDLHDTWSASRAAAGLTRADRTLLKVLDEEA